MAYKTRKSFDIPRDSPVEVLRKTLPKGDGDWPAFGHVWSKLQRISAAMAKDRYTHLSEHHLHVMAAMGTGDEETMKGTALEYGHWLDK